MNRLALIAIGGGSASAMISLSFMAGSAVGMILGYLAPLPLFLIGLGMGTASGAVAGISGTVLAGLLGGAMTSANGMLAAAGFLIVNALPAWLAIHQTMQSRIDANGTVHWRSAGSALAWLAVLGVLSLAVLTVKAWSDGALLTAQVAGYLEAAMKMMALGLTDQQIETLVKAIAPLFPGLVVASWILILALNGTVAQSILHRMKRNLRPAERIIDLVVPDWVSWVLVGAAAIGLIASGDLQYLGRNAVVVLGVPFLFLGLAVAHMLIARAPFPGVAFVLFYFILIVSGWAMLAVAGIGMIEQWAGLRRRFAGPRGQENEPWK